MPPENDKPDDGTSLLDAAADEVRWMLENGYLRPASEEVPPEPDPEPEDEGTDPDAESPDAPSPDRNARLRAARRVPGRRAR